KRARPRYYGANATGVTKVIPVGLSYRLASQFARAGLAVAILIGPSVGTVHGQYERASVGSKNIGVSEHPDSVTELGPMWRSVVENIVILDPTPNVDAEMPLPFGIQNSGFNRKSIASDGIQGTNIRDRIHSGRIRIEPHIWEREVGWKFSGEMIPTYVSVKSSGRRLAGIAPNDA